MGILWEGTGGEGGVLQLLQIGKFNFQTLKLTFVLLVIIVVVVLVATDAVIIVVVLRGECEGKGEEGPG